MKINAFCQSLGWLFDDLKSRLAEFGAVASEEPLRDADAWICLRASEFERSPHPECTVLQIHDMLPHRVDLAGCVSLVHPAQRENLIGVPRRVALRPIGSREIPASLLPETPTLGFFCREGKQAKGSAIFAEAVRRARELVDFEVLMIGYGLGEIADLGIYEERAAEPGDYARITALATCSVSRMVPLSAYEACAAGRAVVSTPREWPEGSPWAMVRTAEGVEALAAALVESVAEARIHPPELPFHRDDWLRLQIEEARRLSEKRNARSGSATKAPVRTGTTSRSGPSALVLDWGTNPVLGHVADSLVALGWQVNRMERSRDMVPEIVSRIGELRPDLLVNQQRLYAHESPILTAVERGGTRQLVLDLGVWPHYGTFLLDSRGDNAAASLVGAVDSLENAFAGSRRLRRASADLEAMRRCLRERAKVANRERRRWGLESSQAFSLLVLQREGDAVLTHDAPSRWRDPVAVAVAAVAAAEQLGSFVVIKPHPQSKVCFPIPEIGPNHRLLLDRLAGEANDLALAWWMSRARNVATVNSTCHFQSLALGVPTACLGRGWFSENGVVLETDSMEKALGNRTRRDAASYLTHLLSRQLRLAEFADPAKFGELMDWVLEGDRVPSDARRRAEAAAERISVDGTGGGRDGRAMAVAV